MITFDDYICFGISPSMLFPSSFDDELEHFSAIDRCCRLPGYRCFETFLPSNPALRREEIKRMKEYGKILNYNTPGYFQLEGDYNASSDDPSQRKHALEAMKLQIEYAAEARCTLMVFTATPDKGPEKRPTLIKRYEEFFLECADLAGRYGMTAALEPIERGRYKNLILGPTAECAAFIKDMQRQGASNARLILDVAHLPLMEETMEEALGYCMDAGMAHVHMGNAVTDPASSFCGHTHPPIGVQYGCYDCPEIAAQLEMLLRAGYIPSEPGAKRATISLEARPYPGVSGLTSAQVMYEKMCAAFRDALEAVKK